MGLGHSNSCSSDSRQFATSEGDGTPTLKVKVSHKQMIVPKKMLENFRFTQLTVVQMIWESL